MKKNKRRVATRLNKKSNSSLFWLIVTIIIFPIIFWTIYQKTQIESKSYSPNTTLGQAANFGGTYSDYIEVEDGETMNPGLGYTVETWIKPPNMSFSSSYRKGSSTQVGTISFQYQNTKNSDGSSVIYFWFSVRDSSVNCQLKTVEGQKWWTAEEQTQWHHIAGVIQLNGSLEIFVDGQKRVVIPMQITNTCQDAYPTEIGHWQRGLMDELRVSSVARYINSFVPIQEEFTPDGYTELLYHFTDLNEITPDSSGNGFTGIIHGNVVPFPEPPTPTPAQFNLLLNNSFELDSDGDGTPDNWAKLGFIDPQDQRSDDFAHSDFYSYKIIGVNNKAKKLHQLVSGNWPAGTTLYLSGWAKAVDLTTNGPVQLGLNLRYANNSQNNFILNFPRGNSYDWTQKVGSVTTNLDVNRLTAIVIYSKNNGQVYFDDVFLSTQAPPGAKPIKLQPETAPVE